MRYELRAVWSLILGIVSILLIWPIGILLGPATVVLATWSLLRIGRSKGALTGSRLSVAGLVMGAVVSGFYWLAIVAEAFSLLLTGSLMPVPP